STASRSFWWNRTHSTRLPSPTAAMLWSTGLSRCRAPVASCSTGPKSKLPISKADDSKWNDSERRDLRIHVWVALRRRLAGRIYTGDRPSRRWRGGFSGARGGPDLAAVVAGRRLFSDARRRCPLFSFRTVRRHAAFDPLLPGRQRGLRGSCLCRVYGSARRANGRPVSLDPSTGRAAALASQTALT